MATKRTSQGQKRFGGLRGKERQNRDRNRAWRLHARQLIEEFVEPPPAQSRKPRHVPIRHRAEFIPSAPVLGSEYGVGTDQELQLVYSTGSDRDRREGEMFEQAYAIIPPDEGDASAIRLGRRGSRDAGVNAAERVALLSELPATKSAGTPSAPADRFTFQGFALGCALGTAAAAVLLMTFRAVLP